MRWEDHHEERPTTMTRRRSFMRKKLSVDQQQKRGDADSFLDSLQDCSCTSASNKETSFSFIKTIRLWNQLWKLKVTSETFVKDAEEYLDKHRRSPVVACPSKRDLWSNLTSCQREMQWLWHESHRRLWISIQWRHLLQRILFGSQVQVRLPEEKIKKKSLRTSSHHLRATLSNFFETSRNFLCAFLLLSALVCFSRSFIVTWNVTSFNDWLSHSREWDEKAREETDWT